MKNEHVLKSFSALSFDGQALRVSAGAAPSARPAQSAPNEEQRDAATIAGDFRAMLIERHNAPYVFVPSYRHWGINE